jgi:hypothetical protein
MEIVIHNLKHALLITVFVFIMMVFIDYLNVISRGRINKYIKGGLGRQYLISSFLGATPGCLGAFMSVSLYVHGIISFGAIVGCMIATSGDEAFVMLALFPWKALLLFFILFVLGIISAFIADKLVKFFKIRTCQACELVEMHALEECRILGLKEAIQELKRISLERFALLALIFTFLYGLIAGIIGPAEWGWEKITFLVLLLLATYMLITVPQHYLHSHIWDHIFKKHFWRVFLWSFGALLIVDVGLRFWNLKEFVQAHMGWVLLLAVLIGIIPESGPHLIFVTMFSKGIIPFSVLLASSIVQDGHGMLPLFSYSIKDSILVKVFNLLIGITVGAVLLYFFRL